MTEITVTPMESDWFGVQVSEGTTVTSHRVRVPPTLLDDLGLSTADRDRIVRESFAFLLDREPASSILAEFSLADVPRYFPEFYEELRRRISG